MPDLLLDSAIFLYLYQETWFMKKTLQYMGIGAVVLAVVLTFVGAMMKVNGLKYADLLLTIGMLSFIVPVLVVVILMMDALAKK